MYSDCIAKKEKRNRAKIGTRALNQISHTHFIQTKGSFSIFYGTAGHPRVERRRSVHGWRGAHCEDCTRPVMWTNKPALIVPHKAPESLWGGSKCVLTQCSNLCNNDRAGKNVPVTQKQMWSKREEVQREKPPFMQPVTQAVRRGPAWFGVPAVTVCQVLPGNDLTLEGEIMNKRTFPSFFLSLPCEPCGNRCSCPLRS